MIIACVKHGRKLYTAEYVNNLAAMVRRNVTKSYRFICLTEDAAGINPEIECQPLSGQAYGWWCKLELFKAGQFPNGERVLYFDLDTLILANIDDLAAYDGSFAGLGCARSNRLFSSGVMAWEAGRCDRFWTDWLKAGSPILGSGDDEWIDRQCPEARRLQRFIPGIYSYKFHKCAKGPPPDARIVFFTRQPKPHNCGVQWVADVWNSNSRITCQP